MKTVYFEEIDSTSTYAKTLIKKGQPVVVVAKKQTGGRGTKGRSFSSNEGGVYLTKLDFYQNFPAKNAFMVMAKAAVAVCKTLEYFSLAPKIKWANDVFVADKKICGILIENGFSGQNIRYTLVGIGLNVSNLLPSELKDIAITMQEATGNKFSEKEVCERLIDELQNPVTMSEYLSRVGYLGQEATLIEGEKRTQVTLDSVQETGELVVIENGKARAVCAGEVSLKLS